MQHAPIHKRKLWRPWLWPLKFLAPRTEPIAPGLWLMNTFCQRVLGINNEIPWMVHFTSTVNAVNKITIGKNVWISFAVSGGCYIQGGNGIEIGDETVFAPGVKIISANHDQTNLTKWIPTNPIKIGNHCWIGANAVILPGINLGNRVIVGACSTVTKSFPDGSVVVGNPARAINCPDVGDKSNHWRGEDS